MSTPPSARQPHDCPPHAALTHPASPTVIDTAVTWLGRSDVCDSLRVIGVDSRQLSHPSISPWCDLASCRHSARSSASAVASSTTRVPCTSSPRTTRASASGAVSGATHTTTSGRSGRSANRSAATSAVITPSRDSPHSTRSSTVTPPTILRCPPSGPTITTTGADCRTRSARSEKSPLIRPLLPQRPRTVKPGHSSGSCMQYSGMNFEHALIKNTPHSRLHWKSTPEVAPNAAGPIVFDQPSQS